MNIAIDFETYCDVSLPDVGLHNYVNHHSFRPLCMAYSVNNGPVKLITDFSECPFTKVTSLRAWNVAFEIAVWERIGWPSLDNTIIYDTMEEARAMSLPGSLAGCGEMLKLSADHMKDKRGPYLIRNLCTPNTAKNVDKETLLFELYDYCSQDVTSEQAIQHELSRYKPISAEEALVQTLNRKINRNGIPIDLDMCAKATVIYEVNQERLKASLKERTGLENPMGRDQFLCWLQRELPRVKIENVQAATLQELISGPIPDRIKSIIQDRLSCARTPATKYQQIQNRTCPNTSRLYGAFVYHAANTGRFTSFGVNFQNLPRPDYAVSRQLDTAIELVNEADVDSIELVFGDVNGVLASCIRSAIKAPEGSRLFVSDFSAIEARVLAWVAGQEDIIQVFRTHGKVYEHTASQIYGKPIHDIDKDERFVGKVATLSLGYGGGVNAFLMMAKVYGISDFDEVQAENIKRSWRANSRDITRLWYKCEENFELAMENKGEVFSYRGLKFVSTGDFMRIILPSGRKLSYYKAGLKGDSLEYVTNKGVVTKTFGGKLVENIVQAIARDLLCEAMLRLDREGYKIVMHIHDEIVAEVPDDSDYTIEHFCSIMKQVPEWASGLPLDCEGEVVERFRK